MTSRGGAGQETEPAQPDVKNHAPASTADVAPDTRKYWGFHEALAWDGDDLVFISDDALASIRRTHLSPSTTGAMRECQARWAAEALLPRIDDPFTAAGLGTAAHTVFERLFQLPGPERTKRRALEFIDEVALEMLGDVPELKQLVPNMKEKVQGLWTIEDPREVDVVQTEFRTNGVKIEGIPFVGVIDRVDRVDDGESIRCVDFKTGSLKPDYYYKRFGDNYSDQLRLYKYAWEQMHPEDTVSIATLYHTGDGKERVVDTSDKAVRTSVRRFQKSWQILSESQDSGIWKTKKSGLCRFCPLASACPVAEDVTPENPLPLEELPRPLSAHRSAIDGGPATATPTKQLTRPIELVDDPAKEALESMKTVTEAFLTEEKPWVATDEGLLNANSYASIALFGLVGMAVDHLSKSGRPIKPSNVRALTDTFATVVLAAQEKVTGSRSWMDGANTRMRGALRTVLESPDMPLPWGQGPEAWQTWVSTAARRSVAISKVVADLYAYGPSNKPWLVLADNPADDDECPNKTPDKEESR